ncbi:MAG: hypothetical protein MUE49_06025 [Rhodospirillales bacterium]|nr:hypothetical protein [Rhodospirillales bacterium]
MGIPRGPKPAGGFGDDVAVGSPPAAAGGLSAAEADLPAMQPRPSRWTGREIVAEMILPLFGLAVVVGIAVFWVEP